MTDSLPLFRLRPGTAAERIGFGLAPGWRVSGPLISCLMVTRGQIAPARFAIRCYQQQGYANRELVIVCDQPGSPLAAHLAELGDPSIRYVETAPATLGELRNSSVAHARGSLLCQWDDDDLYHPQRLELQAAALKAGEAAASFLARWRIWWPARRRLAISSSRIWEGSMLVKRDSLPIYPALRHGEDGFVARMMRGRDTLAVIDQPLAYCYIAHGLNTCGTGHFEMLFANASHVTDDKGYEADLALLRSAMPVDEYQRALGF